jgi:hypothetical protein
MKKLCKSKNSSRESGVALVAAMLMLLLISAVAVGMILASDTESSISSNFRDEQTAFYSARGGVEEVRDRLRANATNSLSASLPTSLPGGDSGVLYIINPMDNEVVAPWNTMGANYPDNEICKEIPCPGGVPGGNPWFTQTTASAAYAATPKLGWKWVRVTAKINKTSYSNVLSSVDGTTQPDPAAPARVCWNGTNEVVATGACGANYQQVYEISAMGMTPRGSRRMVQVDFAHDLPPNVAMPAAVTIDSNATPQCQVPGGSIDGVDHAAPPDTSVAGIGVSAVGGGCQTQGSTVKGGGNCTATPNVCGGLPMGQQLTPGPAGASGLADTMKQMIAGADQTFNENPPSGTNLGALGNPMTTVINNPTDIISGFSGAGVLIINAGAQAQVEISGNLNWKGLVIVYSTADLVVVKVDDGSGRIDGGLLLASNNNTQIQFQFASTGFAGGINYNSAYLRMNSTAKKPLKVIANRELLY